MNTLITLILMGIFIAIGLPILLGIAYFIFNVTLMILFFLLIIGIVYGIVKAIIDS